MNKEQLNKRIEEVCEDFKGQIPDLYQMVGIVIVGRLFGWRVIRLTASRSMWAKVTRVFGDPKEWMPEYGRLAHKSVGLKLVEQIGDFWDFINGNHSREGLTPHDRKAIISTGH
jgi:hypothetical protein